jgi:two-component system copper resistance phosphate regulon response regulator CusR
LPARCSGAASAEPDILRIADLEVHLLRRRVERSGQRIDLTAKEYALLLLLLRRTGEVLSRTLIAEQVWDMNFDSDTNVVEVAVRRLRAKIDDPFDKKLLHTVRCFGYVLEDRGGARPSPLAPVAGGPADTVRGRHGSS